MPYGHQLKDAFRTTITWAAAFCSLYLLLALSRYFTMLRLNSFTSADSDAWACSMYEAVTYGRESGT